MDPLEQQRRPCNKYVLEHNHYESLDILATDTNAYAGMRRTRFDDVIYWINFVLLGVFTGTLAFGISNLEEFLVKYSWWPA